MKRLFGLFIISLIILSLSACDMPTEESLSEPPMEEIDPPVIEESTEVEESEILEEPVIESPPEEQTVTEETAPETESEEVHDDTSEPIEVILPESYADLVETIDTTKLPSQLIDIRFFSARNRDVLPVVPNDGRTYPLGAFRAYFRDGTTIEIDIESPRMVMWYEQMYPYVYHVAHTLGQLPQSSLESYKAVTIVKDLPTPLEVNGTTLRMGQYYVDDAMRFGTLFYELFNPSSLAQSISNDAWSDVVEMDASDVSERSIDKPEEDKLETIWALLYLQQSSDSTASTMLSRLSNRKTYLESNFGFVTQEWINSLSSSLTLPPHDTMNISTNIIYPGLISPEDPSTLESVTFVETGSRYYKRTIYYSEGTGTYPVHTFLATYSNGYQVQFHIDTAFSVIEAEEQANNLAFMYGQVPGLLLAGMDDFILFKGEGHPSSGRVTMFFSNVVQNLGPAIQENLMHDMAHGSLDWDEANGSRIVYDIADNVTPVPHRGVLERNPWIEAAQKDDYYLSLYAKENPEREDIAETVIHYLILRWRPERFDPIILKYIEESIRHRIEYLDQFDWQFPEAK